MVISLNFWHFSNTLHAVLRNYAIPARNHLKMFLLSFLARDALFFKSPHSLLKIFCASLSSASLFGFYMLASDVYSLLTELHQLSQYKLPNEHVAYLISSSAYIAAPSNSCYINEALRTIFPNCQWNLDIVSLLPGAATNPQWDLLSTTGSGLACLWIINKHLSFTCWFEVLAGILLRLFRCIRESEEFHS